MAYKTTLTPILGPDADVPKDETTPEFMNMKFGELLGNTEDNRQQISILNGKVEWKPNAWKVESALPSEYPNLQTTIFLSGGNAFNGIYNAIVRTVKNTHNTSIQYLEGAYGAHSLFYRQATESQTWTDWKQIATTDMVDIPTLRKFVAGQENANLFIGKTDSLFIFNSVNTPMGGHGWLKNTFYDGTGFSPEALGVTQVNYQEWSMYGTNKKFTRTVIIYPSSPQNNTYGVWKEIATTEKIDTLFTGSVSSGIITIANSIVSYNQMLIGLSDAYGIHGDVMIYSNVYPNVFSGGAFTHSSHSGYITFQFTSGDEITILQNTSGVNIVSIKGVRHYV